MGKKQLSIRLSIHLLFGVALLAGCQGHRTDAAQTNTDEVSTGQIAGTQIDPNHRYLNNSTPLIEAVFAGDLDRVRALVDQGAEVNRHGDTYQTPVHFAAQLGRVEILEFLLEQGGGTEKVLHEAVISGNVEILDLLLNHGADIDEKGVDEATPLHVAVQRNDRSMVESLLAHGASVDPRGLYGITPLHIAASQDRVEIGRVLLEHGADPLLQSNGRPVEGRSEEFRKLLEEFRN